MTTVPLPLDSSNFDGCLWPLDPACLLDEWEALDDDAKIRAHALASATLRRLTGYRVGGCPVIVRPCKVTCAEEYGFLRYGYGGPAFTPHINMTGQWVNGCGCRTDCSCGPLCEVRLSPPIGEVISVDVGGRVLLGSPWEEFAELSVWGATDRLEFVLTAGSLPRGDYRLEGVFGDFDFTLSDPLSAEGGEQHLIALDSITYPISGSVLMTGPGPDPYYDRSFEFLGPASDAPWGRVHRLPAEYKVMEDRLVYTGDGDCPFPSCQDLAAAPGEPGTFTVEYRNSYPVDGSGAYAAGLLAVELAKACSGKKCKLPRGTTNVVRQGVSIEITTGMFPDGYTGIDQVDAYISLWKPEGSPRQAPKFWSPRRHAGRVEI